jgi:hypothetical protein
MHRAAPGHFPVTPYRSPKAPIQTPAHPLYGHSACLPAGVVLAIALRLFDYSISSNNCSLCRFLLDNALLIAMPNSPCHPPS